jgi:hypothetical protein
MSFDLVFSAKMPHESAYLQRCKRNALNHFCGNHCGKERLARLQKSHGPVARATASAIQSVPKYLYCLFVTDRRPIHEWQGSARFTFVRGLGNLHRFEAFCSLRVTLIGICISVNESFRDRVLHTHIVATRFIDSLQLKAYSDFDQRHWRQAEVLA